MNNEDKKRARWLKVAPYRVDRIRHNYSLMKNMLNASNYTFTKEELIQVLEALELAHKDFKEAYENAIAGNVKPKKFRF